MICIYVTGILQKPHVQIYLSYESYQCRFEQLICLGFGNVSNLPLLTIGDYYNYSHDKNNERKIKTGQGYGMGYGGCDELCPAAMGLAWLHCFLCPYRLSTVYCCGWQSGHRLIILSTYLLMGAGRLIALLSWVLTLSGPIDWRQRWWRSKHHTESRTQVWRFGVQVQTGIWTP